MSKMLVVQCWDDGVITDIRLTELLRRYGAKATFNLNPGLHTQERGEVRSVPPDWPEWNYNGFLCGKVGLRELREIYEDFSVASHCWRHENAGTLPDPDFLRAALDARHFLEDLFQRDCPGFAWPCGRHTPETRRLLHEAGFLYGRTTQHTRNVTACEDPMMLAASCHFRDENFLSHYEAAKPYGIFYFWGHTYETMNLPERWADLENKIRAISLDPDSEWADVCDIVPRCSPKANGIGQAPFREWL